MSYPKREELTYTVDGKTFTEMHVDTFPEEVFRTILDEPEGDETRSPVLQFRLPNGDLILGFFPRSDTYFSHEGLYT